MFARFAVKLFSIALICLLLGGAFASGASPSDLTVLHEQIVRSYDEGKYAVASDMLQKLRTEDPARYDALPYLLLHARTRWKMKDDRGAYELFRQAESSNQMAPFVHLPLARIAARSGLKKDAVQWYRTYLKDVRASRYYEIATEALEYCLNQSPSTLLETARIVLSNRSTKRLGEFYMARAYRFRNENAQARSLFLTLIRASKKDDVTNRSLEELDKMDGSRLSDADLLYRGRLAYDVWNFELARKYLAPVSTQSAEAAYYYGRSLFFLNDLTGAKKMFELAVTTWPDDPKSKLSLYQWANVSLRNGEYARAEELYSAVEKSDSDGLKENARYKRIQALRAQSNFDGALKLLASDIRSGNSSTRGRALFVSARIHFQIGKYREAMADLERIQQLRAYAKDREVLLWEGILLEKMGRSSDAVQMYSKLADGNDFYAHQAQERFQSLHGKKYAPPVQTAPSYSFARPPDASSEKTILDLWSSGEVLPALLYLHLYEEAVALLPSLPPRTWGVLQVDPRDKQQRYLSIAWIAGLGGDYQTATYYSELFLNTIPRSVSHESLPADVLTVLFPIPYREEILKFCRDRSLDPLMVLAIMRQESKFKRFARSQSFARGLMQLIPPTAYRMASSLGMEEFSLEQLYHPETNINLGTRYMRDLTDEFGNRIEIVAAGYNGGELNVRRWLDSSGKEMIDFFSNIDMKETKDYVMIVKSNYELYKKIYGNL